MWNANTGEKVATLKGHINQVNTIAFSPNGQRLASGGKDGYVRIWDVSSGNEIKALRPGGEAYSVAFSADGKRLASAGDFNSIKIWNVTSGTVLRTLPLFGRGTAVVYSPRGDILASGQNNGKVQVWSEHDGKLQIEFQAHSEFISSLSFSGDGKRLLSTSYDSGATVWNIQDGKGLHGWLPQDAVIPVGESPQ